MEPSLDALIQNAIKEHETRKFESSKSPDSPLRDTKWSTLVMYDPKRDAYVWNSPYNIKEGVFA